MQLPHQARSVRWGSGVITARWWPWRPWVANGVPAPEDCRDRRRSHLVFQRAACDQALLFALGSAGSRWSLAGDLRDPSGTAVVCSTMSGRTPKDAAWAPAAAAARVRQICRALKPGLAEAGLGQWLLVTPAGDSTLPGSLSRLEVR